MNPIKVDMSKAAPRPWREVLGQTHVCDRDGMFVCNAQQGISGSFGRVEQANAALIVRAVNRDHLFEEMVDLARNVGGFDDGLLRSADLGRLRAALSEYREQARAIFAKVQS